MPSLEEIIKAKRSETTIGQTEIEAQQKLVAHILQLEAVKAKLQELLGENWDNWSHDSTDASLEFSTHSRKIEEAYTGNEAVLKEIGISSAEAMADTADFAESPEVDAYNKAKGSRDSLQEMAPATLRSDLEDVGVPVPEKFTYSEIKPLLTERLSVLEKEIESEKMKTPEGKEKRRLELTEKYADMYRFNEQKNSFVDGKLDTGIRWEQVVKLPLQDQEEVLGALKTTYAEGATGSLKKSIESGIDWLTLLYTLRNREKIDPSGYQYDIHKKYGVNATIYDLESDISRTEKNQQTAKKGLEYIKALEIKEEDLLNREIDFNGSRIEFKGAKEREDVLRGEIDDLESKKRTYGGEKTAVETKGYSTGLFDKLTKPSKAAYEIDIGKINDKINAVNEQITNKTDELNKIKRYYDFTEFAKILGGSDFSGLTALQKKITSQPKTLGDYFTAAAAILSEEASKTVPAETLAFRDKCKQTNEQYMRYAELAVVEGDGDPNYLLNYNNAQYLYKNISPMPENIRSVLSKRAVEMQQLTESMYRQLSARQQTRAEEMFNESGLSGRLKEIARRAAYDKLR